MSRFPFSMYGKVSPLAGVGSILLLVMIHTNCGKSQPPPLTIGPSSLPNISTGDPVQLPLGVGGGMAPYRWSVSSGSLPQGLSLSMPSTSSTVALISGTPDTAAQAVNFTVHVTDSSGASGSQPYTMSILLGGDSMTFSPSLLDFDPQLLASSTQQTVTVTNAILSPITISGIAISGTDSSEFGENTTCVTTLAPGTSCTIGVVFTPAQVGPHGASITITDDTLGSPHSVALNGTGIVSGANATFSATGMSFGNVAVGDTSSAQSISLTNYGSSTLNVTSIAAGEDFAETDDCNVPVAPEAHCTVNVKFTPTATGPVSGTLTVAYSGANSPQTLSLSGAGVAGSCRSKGQGCSVVLRCCSQLRCVVVGPFGGGVCEY